MQTEEVFYAPKQDKDRPTGGLSASPQPRLKSARLELGQKLGEKLPSSLPNSKSRPKSQTVKATATAAEFAEVERMRGTGENRLSRQKVVTRLFRIGLAAAVDDQYVTMLEPRIEQIIDRKMTELINRHMYVKAEDDYALKEIQFIVDRIARAIDPNILHDSEKITKKARTGL